MSPKDPLQQGTTSANPTQRSVDTVRDGGRHSADEVPLAWRNGSPSPWTAASVPHPAGVVGPHRDLDPVAGADLGQQARDVGFDGRQAYEEVGGDLGVRAAMGD